MPWIKCLGGSRGSSKTRRGKPLTVSQPIHLLAKTDFEPQCHIFRTKQLRKSKPCHLCHQPVIKLASCCRVCKYTCHKACEDKGARFRDTSQQIHKQWQADPSRAFPTVGSPPGATDRHAAPSGGTINSTESSTPTSTPSPSPTNSQQNTHNSGNYNNETPSKNASNLSRINQVTSTMTRPRTPGVGADAVSMGAGSRGVGGRVSEVMELSYVTERIIALWYREDAQGILDHATTLLRGKHAHNYVIFNLSSPGRTNEPNTRESGWPQNLAPSLERLCALCKELDSWLNGAPNRVAVLHAKGGKERLGVAVSAYMNYSSICGSKDQALDRFAMRRFLDDKIGPLHVPSHRRYVEYFSGLLSGSLRISPSPLYLTHLTVLGVPQFEPNGCRAFLKVYEGLTPVYTSDLYSVTNAREFTVNLGGLRLRGDILIKCYHRVYSKQSREVMFSLQFHTCVITENVVSFPRSELDIACDDPRCPSDSVVTLYFASDTRRQEGSGGPVPAPTPAVPHASAHHDPILHWDSYTNLEISDDEGRETPLSPPPPSNSSVQTSPRGLGYTCGPIDGSLYAVVNTGGNHGTRGSPLTVSMDSGISSAPPQRPSPPEAEVNIDSELNNDRLRSHGDLDKLLHDMMLTVESMPDAPENYGSKSKIGEINYASNYSSLRNDPVTVRKETMERREETRSFDINFCKSPTPYQNSERSGDFNCRKNNQSFSPPGNIEYIDEDIPYHARQTSQPFTYGATTDMIKQQILSSPSLVRKATARGSAPVVQIEDIVDSSDNERRNHRANVIHTPDPPPEFANGSTSVTSNTKIVTDYTDGLSWLRQQQLKLAARRDERSPTKQWRQESGSRVIGELRNVQRGRRQDGYASDSAVLDGDDDSWIHSQIQPQVRSATYTSAPASPLLPQRSSSRKYNGTINGVRQRAESFNERPFVSVKRGYELRSRTSETQSHSDFGSSWTERSVSPSAGVIYHQGSSGSGSTVSRPQTPAFPVHPRTPYVNNGSPTVTFASDKIYSVTNIDNNNLNNNNNDDNNLNNNVNNNINYNNNNNNNNNSIIINNENVINGVADVVDQRRNCNAGNYSTVVEEHRREYISRETGLPPKSPTTQRKDRPVSPGGEYASQSQITINQSPAGTPTQIDFAQSPKSAISYSSINSGGQSSPKVYYGSRRSSVHSNSEPQEVADANVKFVRDTSRIWYKPNISREQAISMLKDATPGMFVVRDSNSFPGAFGLALKVATPPPGAPTSPRDPASELVRHFLIEPTSRGVRLKGCANEPVFSSLSALVYQHSLMAMALPCQLLLPEPEAAARALESPGTSSAQQLLAQGAACNVLYLFTIDTESLTGPQAIKKAVSTLFEQRPLPTATIVHFKVSAQGITLTDNSRKLFFRRHYPTNNISFCGLDTDERTWNYSADENSQSQTAHNCFGFVARKPAHKSDNQCHIFAELEPGQPAMAIVNFVNKVMMGNAQVKANIV